MDTKIRCMYLPTKDSFHIQRHIKNESEGMKKLFHANGNQKKVGVAILVSDKTDVKTKIKTVTRDKQEHYIMIKGSIQDITIVNIYAPNIGEPQ